MTARRLAGVGLGWRPETAWLIDQRPSLGFSEVIAESIDPRRPPRALLAAVERGLPVVTHGVGLSLGGATRPERGRVSRLVEVARILRSPLVSEHLAFCRAGGLEAPHFLPVPRTRAQLAILVDNVRWVQDSLDVPFAIENVAAPLRWPGDELAEAEFLAELLARTGSHLLLDASNLHGNLLNFGGDLDGYLAMLPLDRVAYLHVAGGARIETLWRDTHAHRVDATMLEVLARVLARTGSRPVVLERDHHFGTREALDAELDSIAAVVAGTRAATPAPPAARAPVELSGATRAMRRELAHEQHALLASLLGTARVPPGFDAVEHAEARAIVAGKQLRRANQR
ncbi:MAG: DUF692 domain-containing protein [Myxococcota bacterium]|nr:DUF692 domain-containing protein [Myxococcota bacterium]